MTNANPVSPTPVQKHVRSLDSSILRIEKIILVYLAERMPGWVTPDLLTSFGLAGSVVIFAGYALTFFHPGFLWLASLGFFFNWFGDSLDGTLARVRQIQRPRYGFFIDHIIDAVSEVLVFVGLGLSPYLQFELALLALIAYLLGSIYVYLTTYVNGVFRISFSGLSPTSMRIIAVFANTLVFFTGNPTVSISIPLSGPGLQIFSLFDLIVIALTLAMVALFVTNTLSTASELSREDRAPKRAAREAQKTARREAKEQQRLARKAGKLRARARSHAPQEGK